MAEPKQNKALSEIQIAELNELSKKAKRTEKQDERYNVLLERQKNGGKLNAIGKSGLSKLRDIYVREKYQKEAMSVSKDFIPAAMNGILSEGKSLSLICELDGVSYNVHKKLIKNKYLKGVIDAYSGKSVYKSKKVIDIKTASSMQSLVSLIKDEETKSLYYWQIMGYLAITGAEEGEICHCLVSYPERMINEEINKFIARVKNIGVDGEYIEENIERIRFNMTFDEIPIEQRVVRFNVQRNDDAIKRIYEAVKLSRKWLIDFDITHNMMNIISRS